MTTYPSTMLFGALGQRVAVPWPQSDMGFDINTFTETTDLLSGGQSIYRAPTSYKSYAMSWKGGTLGLQPLIDVCQGMYGNGPFYTTDISSIDRNMLPARWASPYMLSYSANGWGLPTLSSQMVTPERKQVTFTAQSGDPVTGQSIVVPAVPGRPLIATAWGSISGISVLRTNYAATPGFEGGQASLQHIGGNAAAFTSEGIATDQFHSGTASYKLNNCTVAGQASFKAMTSLSSPFQAMPVKNGDVISWSFWVYSTVAGSISPYWEGSKQSDGSYTGGGGGASVAIPANSWTKVTGTCTVTVDSYVAGAGGYSLSVPVGASVWADEFLIEKTATLKPYFDGSTPVATRTNLIPTPSFETGTTGWNPDTGSPTLTSDGTRAYSGTKSLKLVSTAASDDIATSVNVNLAANTTYTLSYYVYSPDARTSSFDIAGTGWTPAGRGITTVPANTWTRVVNTFTTPATAPGVTTFYLHNKNGPTTIGTALWIDAVLLEVAGSAGSYFDGYTPTDGTNSYGWYGAVGSSVSYQTPAGLTYAWSGAANGSPSYQQGSGTGYGAASIKVDAFHISTGLWTAKADLIPSATPVPTVYLTAADTDPKQAGDYDAIRLTLNLPASNSLTLQHLDVSSTDPTLDTKQGKFRSGMGVGPVQFTGNVGGKLTSASIDRIGLTVDVREVERDPHN